MGHLGWYFEIDDDELVVPVAPSGISENLRLAVETLIIPFGLNAEAVQNYLREWRRMDREFGIGYVLETASASARRVSPADVEISDLYGQFDVCTMRAAEFEAVLEGLSEFLGDSIM
ncbi:MULTISPECIES: hypothetical protein [Streptomyces]|uniref:hypothetical protein n=1 Tax=Streptomyces TaxID=1883 RepID=UPI0004A9DF65|nr:MULTISPECIES: hypothetical protein [Streptomyces]